MDALGHARNANGSDASPRSASNARRYCLITPCRNEARYARRTLDSVVRQSERPARWVIVDDGSQDETPSILAEYAARFPWIQVLRRPDRGARKLGGGVIDAFYAGYEAIDPSEFQYLCKLDLDLELPPRYFEVLIDRMEADPRIGTCSGKPYFFPPGQPDDLVELPLSDASRLVSEKIADEHSVGASKFYRLTCFRQIGGFVREVMWDGIDGHRCRQLGWTAASWDDPQELVDGTGPPRVRPVLHGNHADVDAGERRLSHDPTSVRDGWAGDALGVLPEHDPPRPPVR